MTALPLLWSWLVLLILLHKCYDSLCCLLTYFYYTISELNWSFCFLQNNVLSPAWWALEQFYVFRKSCGTIFSLMQYKYWAIVIGIWCSFLRCRVYGSRLDYIQVCVWVGARLPVCLIQFIHPVHFCSNFNFLDRGSWQLDDFPMTHLCLCQMPWNTWIKL